MNFKSLGSSVSSALYRRIGRANAHLQNQRSLPVDVLENDDSYLVVFDAPGAEPDDVQVRYLGGSVRIRIDRFRPFHDGFDMLFPGRGMGLDGEVDLPGDAVVAPDAGTARLSETGTLNIEIPKRAAVEEDGTVAETASSTDADGVAEEVPVED